MGNYSENGIQFTVVDAGIYTGGMKVSRLAYQKDNEGNIQGPQRIVNGIDIDWNNAEVPNIDNPIISTGQLLAIIGELKGIVGGSEEGKSIMSRLEALESELDSEDPQSILSKLTALEEEINGEGDQSISNRISSLENQFDEENPNSLLEKVNSIDEQINGEDSSSITNKLNSIEDKLDENNPDSLAGKISSIEEYINGEDFQGLFSRLSSIENILNNSTFFTVQNENSNNNSNP